MINASREIKKARIAVGRRFGPSPEALEKMRAADMEATWTGKCRRCGAPLKGPLASLTAHTVTCGQEAANGTKAP